MGKKKNEILDAPVEETKAGDTAATAINTVVSKGVGVKNFVVDFFKDNKWGLAVGAGAVVVLEVLVCGAKSKKKKKK